MRKANNLISKGSFVFLVSSAPSTPLANLAKQTKNIFQLALLFAAVAKLRRDASQRAEFIHYAR
jgi:hypothetical protein